MEEKHQFKAEVSKLLDLVINSLYSQKDIFLRELVSNASDACDKLRYLSLVKGGTVKSDGDFKITIAADKDAKTLTISDNGIGMNKEDMINHLSTIAKSGSSEFLANMAEGKQKDSSIIGQFGVGFYSAFMVASKIDVISRKAGEAQTYKWSCANAGEYTIVEDASRSVTGTDIILYLKDDEIEFLDTLRIRHIIKTYSDHISIPIEFSGEVINTASALWSRNKADITKEQYNEFYRHISHNFDEPWMTLHYKAEGKIEYTSLIYIPKKAPFDLFQPDKKRGLHLYANKVFISDKVEQLTPFYLRFLTGIIDTKELPLNVSREMLQSTPLLTKIKNGITSRIFSELKKKSKDIADYKEFITTFGGVLKEGMYEDPTNGEQIAELCRFYSTNGEELTSLDEYIERMADGQKSIFYITGENIEILRNNPLLEGAAMRGVEVLLLTDPVDEFWPQSFSKYKEKEIKSISVAMKELEETPLKDEFKNIDKIPHEELKSLRDAILNIANSTIKDVIVSDSLFSSPVSLVAGEGQMSLRLEKLMARNNQSVLVKSDRILQISPTHSLIKKLAKQATDKKIDDNFKKTVMLLINQAKLIEGDGLDDVKTFMRDFAFVLEKSFD